MNASEIIAALDLSESSQVERRIPKKLLLENSAPTAADKRYISDYVEELWWAAALKPTTIAVPEYSDDVREYLEIAVLRLTMRGRGKASRLMELIHRAVPYPVLLVAEGEHAIVSAAHKRWSQGERGKTVLDGELVSLEWQPTQDGVHQTAFREALAIVRQPRTTLYALYQGWIDTLLALQAARFTGTFAIPDSVERAEERRLALHECIQCKAESERLRAAAAKERQLSRQVELNLKLKSVEAALASARARLRVTRNA